MIPPSIKYEMTELQDEINFISNCLSGAKAWQNRDYWDFDAHLSQTIGDIKVGDEKFSPHAILKALKPDKYQSLFLKYWHDQRAERIAELNELKSKYPES